MGKNSRIKTDEVETSRTQARRRSYISILLAALKSELFGNLKICEKKKQEFHLGRIGCCR